MLTSDANLSRTDHVAGVALIALVENAGPLRKRARNRNLRDSLQLRPLEAGQERHPREQVGRAYLFLAHESRIIADSSHTSR
jgi:hypothetical protein